MGCLRSSESHKKGAAFGRYRFENTDIQDSSVTGINFWAEVPDIACLRDRQYDTNFTLWYFQNYKAFENNKAKQGFRSTEIYDVFPR